MMRNAILAMLLFATVAINTSCLNKASDNASDTDSVQPIAFKEVKIGNQIWMLENLNTDTFQNGEIIPQVKSIEEWLQAESEKKPAWGYLENDPSNGAKYGRLYNWFAINDIRGLAPKGWHIPTETEWTSLINFLSPDNGPNNRPRDRGTYYPSSAELVAYKISVNGSNESGFTALMSGYLDFGQYPFEYKMIRWPKDDQASWWCATEYGNLAGKITLYSPITRRGYLKVWRGLKGEGLSVRCLKDK
jgi:uncharacterized protein (TIGR02145 family)